MTPVPTDEMTSTGFVAYAIEVARKAKSWDEAERAFGRRARWDGPTGPEVSCDDGPRDCEGKAVEHS